jgi:hypothetical protein
MGKPFSWLSFGPGAIMRSQRSPYVCLHKHTSKHTTFFKYCEFDEMCHTDSAKPRSAELEMTVNMLIQIDKLVQLLESPVFTCKLSPCNA